MADYAKDFGPFNERIWLNAASVGPLPRVAVEVAHKMVERHQTPSRLKIEYFHDTPKLLKQSLSQLIQAPQEEIILGNSASYGIHLWANGIPFKPGDEVLLVQGDFPASIYPWLYLREKGVIVREIKPQGLVLHADDVRANLTDATKVLCATWVDSFTGYKFDIDSIGEICQKNGVWFLLNVTQGLGAQPLNVSKLPIDGITCSGYKWMCGPYATGFCWLRTEIIRILEYNQAYWFFMQRDRELNQIRDYKVRTDVTADRYDVFATANLFTYIPWRETINYFYKQGLEDIAKHNDQLVDQFIHGIDSEKYHILSPTKPAERTAIIIVSHHQSERNKSLYELLQEAGIDISYREGYLRFSPHLYNTEEEIDKTLSTLNGLTD